MEWNRRILIVDDYPDIHFVIKSALTAHFEEGISNELLESLGLGGEENKVKSTPEHSDINYEIDSAYQGQEAYRKVLEAEKDKKPYALIFMDMRMPPGWNGLETIKKIYTVSSEIEIVILTAYSDYSWEEIKRETGATEHLHYMKKPFELAQMQQLTFNLVKNWNLKHAGQFKVGRESA